MLHRLRGYTMVEILIVIAIIGVLLAVALPNIAAVRRRSQDEKLVADLGVIETALQQYRQQCKVYPADDNGKLNLLADNGIPGVNNNKCASGSKFKDFLPAGLVIDQTKIQYYALRRPVGQGGADKRCTSYHLGAKMSDANAVPLKRMTTRGWVWKTDSKDIFLWEGCAGGIVPDFAIDVYDTVTPAPY